MNSDDNFVSFGTALDPIEEEEVAKKKPMTISDQIATDEQGRRRFHGAFTGGFSAGYYNTVGSKEGWTPSTFKSSRADRVPNRGQNVTDFMDDEDMGAFGIAPQVLRPTEEFAKSLSSSEKSDSRKRPKVAQSDGPIPGVPVLNTILPAKETIGIKILIKMGWRPGQGVGPRLSRKKKEKQKGKIEEKEEEVEIEDVDMSANKRVYGCQLPQDFSKTQDASSSDEDEEIDITYAPEDIESPLCNPKENTFGLGYKGLERMTAPTGHLDLFGKQLKFKGKDDKNNLNVTGEAFGIGAFEEPDIDVYTREDMSNYDFELETMEERKARKGREALEKSKKKQKDKCIEGFHFALVTTAKKKYYPPPHLPANFQPGHKEKKSRFEQPAPATVLANANNDGAKRGLGRHALSVQERQVLLGEEVTTKRIEETKIEEPMKPEDPPKPPDQDIKERVERIKKFVQVLQEANATTSSDPTNSKAFKPFLKNPEKQERYEKYLTLVTAGFQDSLKDLQPPEMTEWEKEREKQEFERARDIYKPLSGIMSSRFVSAKSHDISHIVPEKEVLKEKDPSEDPKVAARLNLFGRLTHSVVEWHPDKLLCKRFNIKDPFPDSKFVGLRGASVKVATNSTNDANDSVPAVKENNVVPNVTPKKSLFDNLDFSKPPPGLTGGINNATSQQQQKQQQQQQQQGTEANALEFQSKNDPIPDDKENVIVKAPLDLFKQIFADSSDESEDDDKREEAKPIQSPPFKEETQDKTNKILFEKRYNKEGNKDEVVKTAKKSVFDNLDFSKMNEKRERGNSEVCVDIVAEEEEDDKLSYGPRPLSKPNVDLMIPQRIQFSAPSRNSTAFTSSTKSNPSKVNSEEAEVESVWVEKKVVEKHKKSKKSKKTKKEKHKKSSSKKKSKKAKKNLHSNSSSDADSDDSIEIHGSLNQKALLEQLKNISRS